MNINLVIILVFVLHWFASLFFHTAFLHRYSSHKMFKMGFYTERVFYMLTWISQGSSFLVPRAYGAMHRMHHKFSDTKEDPHSPWFFKDIFTLMAHTRVIYLDLIKKRINPALEFTKDIPTWASLDRFGDHIATRIGWGLIYTAVYVLFIVYGHASPFWLLLLPIHYLMGPIQGAVVNWFGHKLGYQNFDNGDKSRNSEPLGIILMGELFQNNHHKNPLSANFAKKWFEFDPTYVILWGLDKVRIIELVK